MGAGEPTWAVLQGAGRGVCTCVHVHMQRRGGDWGRARLGRPAMRRHARVWGVGRALQGGPARSRATVGGLGRGGMWVRGHAGVRAPSGPEEGTPDGPAGGERGAGQCWAGKRNWAASRLKGSGC